MCDYCSLGYHLRCAEPALASIPEDDFMCNDCKQADLVWAKVRFSPKVLTLSLFPVFPFYFFYAVRVHEDDV